MKPSHYHPRRTFSIRIVFFAFPLAFAVLILLPAVYFLTTSAVTQAEQQTYDYLRSENEQITGHLQNIFSTVQHINALNAANVENGNLNHESQEALEQYFLTQVREYDFISSIYFGNSEGGLADAGREAGAGDEFYLIGTENFERGDFVKYALDENGEPTSTLVRVPNFDARSRAWYQLAEEKGAATWTDVYQLFTEQDMAISASHPVYAEDGRLLGVMAADIFLGQLSDFLSVTNVTDSGQSVLLDRDGWIIASSRYDALGPLTQNQTYERLNLETVASPTLNALHDYLLAEGIDLHRVQDEILFSYTVGNDKHYVSITPFSAGDDLDWVSIVILSEDDFMGGLLNQSRIVFFVFLILSALMIFLGVHISRIVLAPLLVLRDKVQDFDIKQPKDIFVETRFHELHEFANAFNALTHRLSGSMSDLYAEIESHKASKAQLLWSETLYRSVVEDSPGLLCSFLPTGEITFANKSYAEYYGVTPREMIGKNFQKLVHEDDREAVMREIYTLDKETPSCSLMQRVYLPSGEIRRQRWVNRALFSEEGKVMGYQAFGEDIQQEYQMQQAQSALYRIWRAANQVSDLAELYPAIHEIIQEIISTKNFVLSLWNKESNMLEVAYAVDEYALPESCFASGPSSYILATRKSLCCTFDEFKALGLSTTAFDQEGCKKPQVWLGVPLVLSGEVIGVITLKDYKNIGAFGDYEKEFLEMISPSIAATIARRHAEEEMALYAQTNLLLLNASQAINESLELDQLYQALYDFITEMMPTDFFIISNYDPARQEIRCECVVQDGNWQDVSEFLPLPLDPVGEATQSRAILHKEARLVDNYLNEIKMSKTPYSTDENWNLFDIEDEDAGTSLPRSGLIVPMMLKGDVDGIIQVLSYRENGYSKRELRIVEALSSQISVARNNINLFRQSQAEIETRSQAEAELQALNVDLEERVEARTQELHKRIATVEVLNSGMSNILHDLKVANKQAEANARNLEEANAELEAFSYSVSHDLRAPLRHMSSFSDLLYTALEERLDEKEKRYFNNIFTATEKMRNLIQDLLALSRAGRTDLKLNQIDMNAIVESARGDLFDETAGRNIKWTIATLPTAQADHGLLKVVWTNLIGNAVKYTRLREKALIEIGSLSPDETDLTEEHQVFFIRDNGVGFDETYIEQLFGVFQRLHQGTEFEGNGIGLATVRRIIARHGGRVWAEGKLEKGATFYFSLPVRIRAEEDEDPD